MIHFFQNAFEAFVRIQKKRKGFDHDAERAQCLRFYKNIAERDPECLLFWGFFGASQNDHISSATIQFCREVQHLNTFCMFSWISVIWGWT